MSTRTSQHQPSVLKVHPVSGPNPRGTVSEVPQNKLPSLLEMFSTEKVLRLEDQFLGDRGAAILSEFLMTHTHFTSIELRGNNLTSTSFSEICKALKSCLNLNTLKAEWNLIGEGGGTAGIEALSELASLLPSLQVIDLRNNKIGPGAGPALSSIIKDAWALRKLDLRWNELTDTEARFILGALRSQPRSLHINLGGNKNNGQKLSDPLLIDINKLVNGGADPASREGSVGPSKRHSPQAKTPVRSSAPTKDIHPYSAGGASKTQSKESSKRSPLTDSYQLSYYDTQQKHNRTLSREPRGGSDIQKRLDFPADTTQSILAKRSPNIKERDPQRRNLESTQKDRLLSRSLGRSKQGAVQPSLQDATDSASRLVQTTEISTNEHQLTASPKLLSQSPGSRVSKTSPIADSRTSPTRKSSPTRNSRSRTSPGLDFSPETKKSSRSTVVLDDSIGEIQAHKGKMERDREEMHQRFVDHIARHTSDERMIMDLERMLDTEKAKNQELNDIIKERLQIEIEEERRAKLAAIEKEEKLRSELKMKQLKEDELQRECKRIGEDCEKFLSQKQTLAEELQKIRAEQGHQAEKIRAQCEEEARSMQEESNFLKQEIKRLVDRHSKELRDAGKRWEDECLKLAEEVNELKLQLKGMSLDQQNEILMMEKRVREEEFAKYQKSLKDLNRRREDTQKQQKSQDLSPIRQRFETMEESEGLASAENEKLKNQLREALQMNEELQSELSDREDLLRNKEYEARDASDNEYNIRDVHQQEVDKIVSGHRIERKSWEEVERALTGKIEELRKELDRSRDEGRRVKVEYNRLKDVIQGNVNKIITQAFMEHNVDEEENGK